MTTCDAPLNTTWHLACTSVLEEYLSLPHPGPEHNKALPWLMLETLLITDKLWTDDEQKTCKNSMRISSC